MTKFCHNCGAEIDDKAEICVKCGVRQPALQSIPTQVNDALAKEKWTAFLFAFLLGPLGAHRFYVGRTGSAVAMLLLTMTLIGMPISSIWAIVDWIKILTGSFTDKDGNKLKQ